MNIFLAALIKDFRLLIKDRVGLLFMFLMPVVLVLIITSVQSNVTNQGKKSEVRLLVNIYDSSEAAILFIHTLDSMQIFDVGYISVEHDSTFLQELKSQDALLGIRLSKDFSPQVNQQISTLTSNALARFGMASSITDTVTAEAPEIPILIDPELGEGYRIQMKAIVQNALSLTLNRLLIRNIFHELGDTSARLSDEMPSVQFQLQESAMHKNKSMKLPDATQHNIPAWSLFAMFFIVVSLGSNVAKEKLSGNFQRLKTMPVSIFGLMCAKQVLYLGVVATQVILIFSIGVFLFPIIGMPGLHLPEQYFGLIWATLLSGWCAISYAICVGLFARTQEQSNGFGAVSVVIFAAIGGIFVPQFAMPSFFRELAIFSPLHWGLEVYYGVFLHEWNFGELVVKSLPLLFITALLQTGIFLGIKLTKSN